MTRYTIRYQYGSYSGTEEVSANDGDQAIALMWFRFDRQGLLTLPMAHRSAKVIAEEDAGDSE